MRRAWMAAPALFLSAAAIAADVAGSADLERVPRFAQAQIIDYRQSTVQERIYPQDSIRRISGNLRMAAQVVASGRLTAVTYQLPASHTGIEAFTQARGDLLEQGAELLFWCEGRECGSSSLWANAIFGKSMLYGPEAQQAYLLARLPERETEGQDDLIALYGVTRGNGRPYLHVEQLQPDEPLAQVLPTAATLLRQLRSTGELRLPRLADQPTAEWGELLANVLRLDSTTRISLAGQGAAAWREALIAERIRGGRLEVDESQESGLLIRLLR
ncbi:type IIA topoisomerase (DNA gyrase/topo II, topoisomerase IV), A subunit [Stutzerimonas stutzeri]|jgi:Domain of unknown function (DUF4892)|uniref:DUF4892 domain-containing protein n=1 Tax=Stutzerimonas stutzeri TaxID=316 RepID=UPI00222E8562|nr:DUF4892 domain-containing protein [Stutzerimonas stutzeri]GBC56440.1 type IIA topoisomerase (DNA gyrase/topo II, topoisomerase IV), A subunit [Stutzerimonas stutzeri]